MSKFQFDFNDSPDCKLYVVSDLHLNHKQEFLWRPRGFKSAQDHTRGLIDKINQVCRPQDILLSLGDPTLNTPPKDFDNLVSQIKCQQWWLKGNHNNPWEKDYQSECTLILEYEAPLSDYFKPEINGLKFKNNITIWGQYLEFNWNGQPTCFFHYPIAVWNQMQHGSWCLCGHSHYSFQLSRAEDTTMKLLDCGWEGNNGPWSFEEVKAVMNKKKIPQQDHHNEKTN